MESGRKAHENGPDEAVRDLGREQLLNCLDQRQERSLIKADQNLRFATMKVHKALSSFPLRAKMATQVRSLSFRFTHTAGCSRS